MGELKEVVIIFSSNPQIFQVIDIVVVAIPKEYGIILSRDWSSKLNGYFSTDQSQFLLPSKENFNL